jgi:branched-chain amino acid transport system ATP-binding protein
MSLDRVQALSVSGLSVSYGVGLALSEVDIFVKSGQVVAILGSNGAGKSTLLRTIMALVRPIRGDVRVAGELLNHMPTIQRVRHGLALVPEGRRIFVDLTVQSNLEVAAAPWRRLGASIQDDLDRIFELFPILEQRRHRSASELSGGEQQMLAIGRALMARPRVLLLDEPSLGLAPLIVRSLMDLLTRIASDGRAILLAEQNVHQALRIADHAYVLANGRIALSGSATELRGDPRLRAAYLGGAAAV